MGEGSLSIDTESAERVELVAQLLAKIVEVWSGTNPQKAQSARALVNQHMQAMGILHDNGTYDIQKWMKFLADIGEARANPVKPDDYPNYDVFKEAMYTAAQDQKLASLLENIQSRNSQQPLSKYLYGLGIVMSSKIAYQSIFTNDPIVFGKGYSVQNGRHRYACLSILSAIPYNTSNWNEWIQSEYE